MNWKVAWSETAGTTWASPEVDADTGGRSCAVSSRRTPGLSVEKSPNAAGPFRTCAKELPMQSARPAIAMRRGRPDMGAPRWKWDGVRVDRRAAELAPLVVLPNGDHEGALHGPVAATHWHGLLENDGLRRAFLSWAARRAGRDGFVVAADTSFGSARAAQLDPVESLRNE